VPQYVEQEPAEADATNSINSAAAINSILIRQSPLAFGDVVDRRMIVVACATPYCRSALVLLVSGTSEALTRHPRIK
jgi:hypothetical protein